MQLNVPLGYVTVYSSRVVLKYAISQYARLERNIIMSGVIFPRTKQYFYGENVEKIRALNCIKILLVLVKK